MRRAPIHSFEAVKSCSMTTKMYAMDGESFPLLYLLKEIFKHKLRRNKLSTFVFMSIFCKKMLASNKARKGNVDFNIMMPYFRPTGENTGHVHLRIFLQQKLDPSAGYLNQLFEYYIRFRAFC